MNYLIEPFRYAFDFSGRSSRKQFWLFWLWAMALALLCLLADFALDTESFLGDNGLIGGIFNLVFFFPNLAIGIRRMHDSGRSGWWLLINLVPIIGALYFLYLLCQDSDSDNEYGPSMKYPSLLFELEGK